MTNTNPNCFLDRGNVDEPSRLLIKLYLLISAPLFGQVKCATLHKLQGNATATCLQNGQEISVFQFTSAVSSSNSCRSEARINLPQFEDRIDQFYIAII